MQTFFQLLANANDDSGAGAVFLILICIGLCLVVNKKPPTKIEESVGRKVTRYE